MTTTTCRQIDMKYWHIITSISGCCKPRHNYIVLWHQQHIVMWNNIITSTFQDVADPRQISFVKHWNRCEISTLSHLTFQDVATHVIITSFCDINNMSSNRYEILTILSHLTFQDVATHVIITSFCDINNMSSNRYEILTILSHLTFQDVANHRFVTSTTVVK